MPHRRSVFGIDGVDDSVGHKDVAGTAGMDAVQRERRTERVGGTPNVGHLQKITIAPLLRDVAATQRRMLSAWKRRVLK